MAAFIAAAKALKKGGTSVSKDDGKDDYKKDCPFDLDEIFKADTDRFGQLQDVIKYLFDHLRKANLKIEQVDMKMVSKFMEIS